MCSTVKEKKSKESGFTLLEIALVITLIGLVIASATSVYHIYTVEKDWKETEDKIDVIQLEVGNYRDVYNRYPCPSPSNAVPGDLEYGHESCTPGAAGTCVNGICTYENPVTNELVMVGNLPFKTLNLQERDIYDSYLNKFTYAVTDSLTDQATFTMAGGAITVLDPDGNSVVKPDGTAHFIVISHGANKAGGFTRAGLIGPACASGSALEQENCDDDAIFLASDFRDGFDDRITYFSSVDPSEWQISDTDQSAIHLKTLNSIAIAAPGNDLTNAAQATIRDFGIANSGFAYTDDSFLVDNICEYDGNDPIDCFAPRRIAGTLLEDTVNPAFSDGSIPLYEDIDDSGMSCYEPGVRNDFLVGISNGGPDCESELFLSCPSGTFIQGIETDGSVICDSFPEDPCVDDLVTPTCGGSETLSGTFSGNHSSVYSGECRMITNYDDAYFTTALSGMTPAEVETHIDTINAEARTIASCGSGASDSLVRDAYLCTAGVWSLASRHEKLHPWTTYTSNHNAGSPWPAETGYTGDDLSNTNNFHDCWCREDYRVITDGICPGGLTGTRIRIQKHRCPQTSHVWETIFTSTEGCGCVEREFDTLRNCNAYYDSVNGTTGTTGLIGNATLTYGVTCVDGSPVTSADPIAVDTGDCACSASRNVTRTDCPTGLTNIWTWPGGTETGVSNLQYEDMVCPGTQSNGVVDPPVGSGLITHSPIPACTCDTALTDEITIACPDGQAGLGNTYEREWDCVLGDWEPEAEWELLSGDCNTCSWKKPATTPSLEEFAYGEERGTICACGSSPIAFCHQYATGGNYSVWTDCPCEQND